MPRIKFTLKKIECIGPCENQNGRGEFTWSFRIFNAGDKEIIVHERLRYLYGGVLRMARNDKEYLDQSIILTVNNTFKVKGLVEEWDKANNYRTIDVQFEGSKKEEFANRRDDGYIEVKKGEGNDCGLRFLYEFEPE